MKQRQIPSTVGIRPQLSASKGKLEEQVLKQEEARGVHWSWWVDFVISAKGKKRKRKRPFPSLCKVKASTLYILLDWRPYVRNFDRDLEFISLKFNLISTFMNLGRRGTREYSVARGRIWLIGKKNKSKWRRRQAMKLVHLSKFVQTKRCEVCTSARFIVWRERKSFCCFLPRRLLLGLIKSGPGIGTSIENDSNENYDFSSFKVGMHREPQFGSKISNFKTVLRDGKSRMVSSSTFFFNIPVAEHFFVCLTRVYYFLSCL